MSVKTVKSDESALTRDEKKIRRLYHAGNYTKNKEWNYIYCIIRIYKCTSSTVLMHAIPFVLTISERTQNTLDVVLTESRNLGLLFPMNLN